MSKEYIEDGGRCKEALYLCRHRCVKVKGRGYRCKYCDTPLIELKRRDRRRGLC